MNKDLNKHKMLNKKTPRETRSKSKSTNEKITIDELKNVEILEIEKPTSSLNYFEQITRGINVI